MRLIGRMQISRHWRMNSARYRLQGEKDEDGRVTLDGAHWYESEAVLAAIARKEAEEPREVFKDVEIKRERIA